MLLLKSEQLIVKGSYLPYLTLWGRISQNFALLEGSSYKNLKLTEFSDHFTTYFMKK